MTRLLPSKTFLIAGALAWSGLIAAMLSMSREPAPAESAPVVAKFDSRWEELDDPPLLKKQDRLALPVVTERVPVSPLIALSVDNAAVETAPKKPVERHRHVGERRNICSRHGMHRVITHGGRSWRCRK
jgi:hypothetical protein